VALTAFFSTAALAAQNNTPHALSCMKRVGITHEGWVAHNAGTNEQVQQYIACRDGISSEKAHEKGRRNGNFGGGY
jgi:hypothetical protein